MASQATIRINDLAQFTRLGFVVFGVRVATMSPVVLGFGR